MVIIYNCAQRSNLLPALELVSTVKVLLLYAQCSNVRVKMLAKFILSLMDFAVHNSDILELNDEEVKYYRDQLVEAKEKGSTSHWYIHHELLQLLVNLIKSNSKNFATLLNSVFELLIQSLQSNKKEVQEQALKVVLYLYSQSDLLTTEQLAQIKKETKVVTWLDDHGTKETAVCVNRLMSGEWESMLVATCHKSCTCSYMYVCLTYRILQNRWRWKSFVDGHVNSNSLKNFRGPSTPVIFNPSDF